MSVVMCLKKSPVLKPGSWSTIQLLQHCLAYKDTSTFSFSNQVQWLSEAPFSLLKAVWPPTGFFQRQSWAEKEQLTALVQRKARRVADSKLDRLYYSVPTGICKRIAQTQSLTTVPSRKKSQLFLLPKEFSRSVQCKSFYDIFILGKRRGRNGDMIQVPLLICAVTEGKNGLNELLVFFFFFMYIYKKGLAATFTF